MKKKTKPNRLMVKFVLTVMIGMAAFVAYVRYVESTTVFLPDTTLVHSPKSIGLPFEDVSLQSGPYKIHGWFIPGSEQPRDNPSFIFLHGNAGNIGDRLEKLKFFHSVGVNTLIIDYRGYGMSEGKSTEQGMYDDAKAAFDYLAERSDIDSDRICVFGASLGGVAAVDLAIHRPVAAVVLDSTFTSAADMAKVILPVVPSFMLSYKLDSSTKIKGIKAPILFLHSPDDGVVPYRFGRALYDLAPEPKHFVDIQGTHNDWHVYSETVFVDNLKEFLEQHQLLSSTGRSKDANQ